MNCTLAKGKLYITWIISQTALIRRTNVHRSKFKLLIHKYKNLLLRSFIKIQSLVFPNRVYFNIIPDYRKCFAFSPQTSNRKWKKVKTLSLVRLFVTPWTVAYQVPPSMGFSRQEYWSGAPFPSPGDLPDPGIEPGSPTWQADALLSEPPGKLTNFI